MAACCVKGTPWLGMDNMHCSTRVQQHGSPICLVHTEASPSCTSSASRTHSSAASMSWVRADVVRVIGEEGPTGTGVSRREDHEGKGTGSALQHHPFFLLPCTVSVSVCDLHFCSPRPSQRPAFGAVVRAPRSACRLGPPTHNEQICRRRHVVLRGTQKRLATEYVKRAMQQ